MASLCAGQPPGHLHCWRYLDFTNEPCTWHYSHVHAGELRQPLCLVLLRNCSSPYEAAVTAAVRLFEAVLSAQASFVWWLLAARRCLHSALLWMERWRCAPTPAPG